MGYPPLSCGVMVPHRDLVDQAAIWAFRCELGFVVAPARIEAQGRIAQLLHTGCRDTYHLLFAWLRCRVAYLHSPIYQTKKTLDRRNLGIVL